MEKTNHIGSDVYGKYFKRKGTTFRIGDCIKLYTTNFISKVLGEIIDFGQDSRGSDYILIKEKHEDYKNFEYVFIQRKVYLYEIYD